MLNFITHSHPNLSHLKTSGSFYPKTLTNLMKDQGSSILQNILQDFKKTLYLNVEGNSFCPLIGFCRHKDIVLTFSFAPPTLIKPHPEDLFVLDGNKSSYSACQLIEDMGYLTTNTRIDYAVGHNMIRLKFPVLVQAWKIRTVGLTPTKAGSVKTLSLCFLEKLANHYGILGPKDKIDARDAKHYQKAVIEAWAESTGSNIGEISTIHDYEIQDLALGMLHKSIATRHAA